MNDSPHASPLSPYAHGLDVADLDAWAERLSGYFVVQVAVDDDGHRRTFFYRNVAAAERAVARAQARGRRAHVTLAQVVPVGVVMGVRR